MTPEKTKNIDDVFNSTEDLKVKMEKLSKKLGNSDEVTLDTISTKLEKIKSPPTIA